VYVLLIVFSSALLRRRKLEAALGSGRGSVLTHVDFAFERLPWLFGWVICNAEKPARR